MAEIARGQRNRLDASGPTEIQPLVDEINGLLDERDKEIALARNRAADLAHGLKTPLTALAADARLLREKGESDIAQSLERVSDAMQRHVARELARARVKRVRRGGKPRGSLDPRQDHDSGLVQQSTSERIAAPRYSAAAIDLARLILSRREPEVRAYGS